MIDIIDLDTPIVEVRRGLRVAVVDDDNEFRDELIDMLSRKSFASTKDPIDVSGERFEIDPIVDQCVASDALVVDLDLGFYLDGITLAQKVQAVQPEKWIIAVSAHDQRLQHLKRNVDFEFQAALPKSAIRDDIFIDTLDRLAKRKRVREVTHRLCYEKLMEAASSTGTIDKQLALASARSLLKTQLLSKARERNRIRVDREGPHRPSFRYEIVLMICTALDRLSFVQGETLAVPTDDQLRELAACVQILKTTPLLEKDELDVYDRLRFARLGLASRADSLPPAEQLSFQDDYAGETDGEYGD